MRKRNNPLTDIPIGLCIVFIVMGLLLEKKITFIFLQFLALYAILWRLSEYCH